MTNINKIFKCTEKSKFLTFIDKRNKNFYKLVNGKKYSIIDDAIIHEKCYKLSKCEKVVALIKCIACFPLLAVTIMLKLVNKENQNLAKRFEHLKIEEFIKTNDFKNPRRRSDSSPPPIAPIKPLSHPSSTTTSSQETTHKFSTKENSKNSHTSNEDFSESDAESHDEEQPIPSVAKDSVLTEQQDIPSEAVIAEMPSELQVCSEDMPLSPTSNDEALSEFQDIASVAIAITDTPLSSASLEIQDIAIDTSAFDKAAIAQSQDDTLPQIIEIPISDEELPPAKLQEDASFIPSADSPSEESRAIFSEETSVQLPGISDFLDDLPPLGSEDSTLINPEEEETLLDKKKNNFTAYLTDTVAPMAMKGLRETSYWAFGQVVKGAFVYGTSALTGIPISELELGISVQKMADRY